MGKTRIPGEMVIKKGRSKEKPEKSNEKGRLALKKKELAE